MLEPSGYRRGDWPVDATEPDARARIRGAEREADPSAAVEADADAADHVTKRPLPPHPGEIRASVLQAPSRRTPTACPRCRRLGRHLSREPGSRLLPAPDPTTAIARHSHRREWRARQVT